MNNIWMILFAIAAVSFVALLIILFLILGQKRNLKKKLLEKSDADNASYQKFLVDSRDWAFEYIEEVQTGLKAYVDVVGPQLDYYNTYGRSSLGPHVLMLDNILPAFEELKALLPEENKEK